MGASSVTGKGPGDASGATRGPGNNRNQYSSLLDPVVVWHGTTLCPDFVGTVSLPSNIRIPPEQISVFVSGVGFVTQKNLDGDGNVESFTVVGIPPDTGYLDYIVVQSKTNRFCEDFDLVP